jgi:hypothetical protein
VSGPGDINEAVVLPAVPVRPFLESQDHQHDLIRELRLIDLGERFDVTSAASPRDLARMISEILVRYGQVRAATREQAVVALNEGKEVVDLRVPVRPGMADALRRWLQLLEEADRFCEQGDLLTLAAPSAVRELRRWYVEQLTRCLE